MKDFNGATDEAYVKALQEYVLPDNPFHIKRRSNIVECAIASSEKTTWKVIGDPVMCEASKQRNYLFCECKECGFRRNVRIGDLMNGHTRCEKCFDTRLKNEADSLGFDLIGDSTRGPRYRIYKSRNCGHIADIDTKCIREKTYVCRQCYFARLLKACEGTTLVPTVDVDTARCTFQTVCQICGNKVMKNISKVGSCQNCVKLQQEVKLKKQNVKIIEKLHSDWCNFELQCGHTQIMQKSRVLAGNFECRTCAVEYLESFAKPLGIIVHHGNYGKHYKILCTLPCGCNKYVHREELYRGRVYCKTHGDSHFNSKRFLYLLKITHAEHSWLKLGIAMDIDRRIRGYKLNEGSEATLVSAIEFDTGYLAIEVESNLHYKFESFNLDNELMKTYMKSGWSECYPVDKINDIVSEMGKFRKGEQ